MSWDIIVQDIPAAAKSIADIPDDFEPRSIGSRAELIAAISTVLPAADFSDPAWGTFDDPDGRYSVEFGMDDDEEVYSFAMHIRGDETVVPVISAVLKAVGRRAFDASAGTIFDESRAYESLKSFNTHRDQTLGK